MPLECQRGGNWIDSPQYPPHRKRECALLKTPCGKTWIYDHACEKCSGADDGTSIVSQNLAQRKADAERTKEALANPAASISAPRQPCVPCAAAKAKRAAELAALKAAGLSNVKPRIKERERVNAGIYITIWTGKGTSTTEIELAEKLAILRKCYDSCRREGFNVTVVASGDSPGVEAVRKVIPGVPLHGVWGQFDRQRGECVLSLRCLEEAERDKVDWAIKVAGDTYYPAPGWATKLIEQGEARGAELISCQHHRPDWVTTQNYAARPGFMRRTFPPIHADYGRIGIEAQWGERIAAAGLAGKWYQPPGKLTASDGTSNVVPESPEITYLHAHCLASTAAWKPIDSSIKPDLGLKISIVIPARNEDGPNPRRNNVPLLADTFNSIRETSPADNLPECILIDDGSDRPLPHGDYPGLKIIRNEQPQGVDPARNQGILAATGDVIGILDAHMRVELQDGGSQKYGVQKIATFARDKGALACGRCAHLEADTGAENNGGYFVPLAHPNSQLALGFASYTPPDTIRKANAVLGASYFAPTAFWRKSGGFVNDCKIWGYSEEGLSLKAAFMDVPIYYCGEVTFRHWFRPNGPHPFFVDGWHKFVNRAKVLRVTFSQKCFYDFWMPRLKASTGEGTWQAGWDNAMETCSIREEHEAFQKIKVKSDAQVLKEVFQADYA